jgi:ADP-ribosylglycohydrolase
MSTDALVIGPDRVAGALLGVAVGDALGWPQENRSRIVGGKAARDAEPTPKFRNWMRTGGTRYASYEDPVRAGEYSDDTQLTMAVARACMRGAKWERWLTAVELPQWTLYQRGGGGAVLRAARAWSRGHPPWQAGTASESTARKMYFDAGGNGVAMRIAPHAVVTAASDDKFELALRVIQDGLTTHGHPRALLGALIHAEALRYALRRAGTLEYGELLDQLIDDQSWRDPRLIDATSPAWQEENLAAAASQPAAHVWEVWDATIHEVLDALLLAKRALGRGALANDHETLEALGCLDSRRSGAGTVAAVAALYVASRSATRPISGLLRTAFLRGADTDTIASMTAALLGALHGTAWLGQLGRDVQDGDYLRDLAALISG